MDLLLLRLLTMQAEVPPPETSDLAKYGPWGLVLTLFTALGTVSSFYVRARDKAAAAAKASAEARTAEIAATHAAHKLEIATLHQFYQGELKVLHESYQKQLHDENEKYDRDMQVMNDRLIALLTKQNESMDKLVAAIRSKLAVVEGPSRVG